jgi:hypothetical protein
MHGQLAYLLLHFGFSLRFTSSSTVVAPRHKKSKCVAALRLLPPMVAALVIRDA